MIAVPFKKTRSLCLLAVSVIVFFSPSCTPGNFTPSPTDTHAPLITNPPLPAEPTATFLSPTVTVAMPTSTPLATTNPEGAPVRLNLGAVEQIALSPGSDRLVAVGATHICLYDTVDFKQAWCTPSIMPEEFEKWGNLRKNNEEFVRTIVFRPNGNQIAYALWYGAVVLLDSTNGQRLNVIDGDLQNSIKELVWTPNDDHLIIWSSQGGVDIWNIATVEKVSHLEIDSTQIQSAAWTPDGNMAAFKLKDSGMISLWDITTLQQTGSIDTMLPDFGFKLALSPDGSIVYASVYTLMGACGAEQEDQGWIKAWDIATSDLIFDIDINKACMQSMSVSPDGRWLAGITGYGKLKVLSASFGSVALDLPYNFFTSMVWLGGDRFLFTHYPSNPYGTADFKSIGMLDINTEWITPIYLPGFENIYSLAWLPDGERLVTNSIGGTLSIWQAASGERIEQFPVTYMAVSLTNFSPASISPVDGKLAVPAQQSVATIDLESGQVLKIMDFNATSPDTHAAYTNWSGDGKRLAAQVYGNGAHTIVWDAATGKALLTVSFESRRSAMDLALSLDGSKLALSEWLDDGYRLSIWDIEANKEIASIKTPEMTRGIIWINENQVALSRLGGIDLYDITTGKKVPTLAEGYTFAFSRDNRFLAAEELLGGITISDFSTGKVLAELNCEPAFLNYLAFSPGGKLLAALTEFGSVIIWDISQYY